ncbi:uncharacterized protein LOC123538277 [Mercenaria mercenaria]|uniref:uncharacterized protein LOC123538277 n=1 Tax=Mercenaria mercenaria TaxID=6596 RepID=UPI00234ED0B7|nr:uncharacterized protein LOC123538277 [Mercenaria mercenaria]
MSDSVGGRKKSDHGTRQEASLGKGVRSSDMSVYKSSAEVSERDESSIYKGSDDCSYKYSCDPCRIAGDHLEAQGFCTDCDEYLCSTCYKSHPRNKVSRHHTLLDKENIPKESTKYCDPCKHAGDEVEAAGFCRNCEDYLCSTCFRSHARNKASRYHVLLDKDKMPAKSSDFSIVSSVEKVNISKKDAENDSYNEKYSYIRDINAKVEKDENICVITGMVLISDTELVLVDERNKALKFIDIENDVIKDDLKLSSHPFGISPITQHKLGLAVVLGNELKIHIISTTTLHLSIIRTLKTDGFGMDTKYINRRLYVSYCKPVKIQILQLTGEVYKIIQPGSEVLNVCTLPRFIAVSPDKNSIYMSDWETSNVIHINMKGRMISVHKGELALPQDIAISPFKSVYLCNAGKHIICKMMSDLSDITTILDLEDGLNGPRAICFNNVRRHLYISSGCEEPMWANCIKVYQWN